MSLNTFALLFIGFYQRYLSPRKGFRCAHAAFFGGDSCSHAVKAIVLERGLWAGRTHIRARFDECRVAAQVLSLQRSKRRQKSEKGKRSWLDVAECSLKGADCCCIAWG